MTPERMRERLEESGDRIDIDRYLAALQYVRDDGRTETEAETGF